MGDEFYSNGEYLQNNPSWGVEDSIWKAEHVEAVIADLGLAPKLVAEIGCGAGEILNQLHGSLPSDVNFCGFEISPQAFELCQERKKDRLDFQLGGVPPDTYFDLLLSLDVFEHVEDYFGFLKEIRNKAEYKIFHIPLDLSVRSVFLETPISHAHDSVGHLHYFSKETALSTLVDCGYEILVWYYTSGPINRPSRLARSMTSSVVSEPLKRFVFRNFPDEWVRLLGGSILVVAK